MTALSSASVLCLASTIFPDGVVSRPDRVHFVVSCRAVHVRSVVKTSTIFRTIVVVVRAGEYGLVTVLTVSVIFAAVVHVVQAPFARRFSYNRRHFFLLITRADSSRRRCFARVLIR